MTLLSSINDPVIEWYLGYIYFLLWFTPVGRFEGELHTSFYDQRYDVNFHMDEYSIFTLLIRFNSTPYTKWKGLIYFSCPDLPRFTRLLTNLKPLKQEFCMPTVDALDTWSFPILLALVV